MFAKFRKIMLLCVFFGSIVMGQDRIGVHQYDKMLNSPSIEKKDFSNTFTPEIIPLVENKSKSLSGAVFGYLPDWEYLNGSAAYFKYDLLTHIACFDFAATTTGTISNPSGWPWTGVINSAHLKGVKIIMCITNFDGDEIHTIITTESVKQAFFANVVSRIQAYNMDGVNIDFESLNSADRGSIINNFMTELTNYVHTNLPGKEVSFAGPAVNWSGWNFTGLAASCDYIFIMGYDFFGSWSSTSGPSAPLYGGNYNISNTVLSQYASVVSTTPEKLILGVPYFGTHFITTGENPGATVTSYVGSPRFSSCYPGSQTYGYLWHSTYKVPWYKYQDGSSWHQVFFDDDSSLGLKYDLAISKNLKGIGMWALGYDSGRQELWNLISAKFGGSFEPIPAVPNYIAVVNKSATSISIKTELPSYASGIRVFISKDDGATYKDSLNFLSGDITINNLNENQLCLIKIKAFNISGSSDFSETFAICPQNIPAKVLIVNGFDRIISSDNTRDYIKIYGKALAENLFTYNFDCANNEAVYLNQISLDDYYSVIWILGEESTADETFNSLEQTAVKNFLAGTNKSFLVSGSEIGWDLGRSTSSSASDLDFYNNYLKATYYADAPQNSSATYYAIDTDANTTVGNIGSFNFDDGTHGMYDTEWPDAIKPNGSNSLFLFNGVNTSLGQAGISYNGAYRLVYCSFPIETVYPEATRNNLIYSLMTWLINPTDVKSEDLQITSFDLAQNFPNPFNPSTTIAYQLQSSSKVILKVYDVLGKEVALLVNDYQNAGKHSINFDASNLSSGLYFAKITAGNFVKTIKMSLVK